MIRTTPGGVIPYVEAYDGRTRVMHLLLRSNDVRIETGAPGNPDIHSPVVAIDGRPYQLPWESVSFEIPAERACHVSVSYAMGLALATALIPPGDHQLTVEYQADGWSGRHTVATLVPVPPTR